MGIASTLRDSTADAHRRAESRPMQKRLVSGELDAARLALYLGQLHHLHEALERLFDTHPEQAAALEWEASFRHSERLRTDLDAMGMTVRDLPLLKATTAVVRDVNERTAANGRALIGAFYVLEGSMNGNRFIVKGLRKKHPMAARCAFSYFDPYGDEQPARWATFKTGLDALSLREGDDEAMVNAALAMFEGIGAIADEVSAYDVRGGRDGEGGVPLIEIARETKAPRCPLLRIRKRMARSGR